MMAIDVTRFVREQDPEKFSASPAEWGEDAAKATWRNALDAAATMPLLTTPQQLAAMRNFIIGFGAWSADQIAGWSDEECNALFIQMLSSDLCDVARVANNGGEIDWQLARRLSKGGAILGNLYRAEDGRIYFDLEL